MDELIDVSTKLEIAGYRLSESKYEISKTESDSTGQKRYQNGIRPLQDKLLALKNRKTKKNHS